ncbi:MAG TPA: serine hydrolase [Sunxiuqinia sp.]|nr:serine hydrolase [Sunxiuqinia sp.]
MKKRIIWIIVLLFFAGGIYYLNLLMPIITGYSAKNLASGVFVAGRTQESLESEDLNFSVIQFVHNSIDYDKHEVTSRFLWGKSKAIYIPGFGCTLVKDFSEDEIRNRPYRVVKPLPENPDSLAWPMGNMIADTFPSNIDRQKLSAAVRQAMADTIPYKGTFATMVIYKGQPIAEVYRDDFSPDNRLLSWSMAKSFTNALVGIRVKEGKLDINKQLLIKDWQKDDRKKITLNNLLHQNSGLAWNETYGNLSDVTKMLHEIGDMGLYTQEKAYQYPADSVWNYSSGTANLVSRIVRQSFDNDADYYAFPRKNLFNKIGMTSAIWEVDASGTFVGSSYLYASLRDFARFGLLYLNHGNWLGDQVLPIGWVDYTTQPSKGSEGQYGAFFWLNRSGDFPSVPKEGFYYNRDGQTIYIFPHVPEDMFYCEGHDGQFICIIPSKDLVVVRMGYSKPPEFNMDGYLNGILESIK